MVLRFNGLPGGGELRNYHHHTSFYPLIIPRRNLHVTLQISEAYPDVIAMKSRNIVTEEWSTWTYKRLASEVQNVSKALIETGLHRHHCVVIIGLYNCPLWVISHLAAISAG